MSEITVPDPDELILSGPKLSTPSQVNRSTWTGRRKVVGLAGAAVWQGNFAIADIATEEAERPWRAFLFGLEGPQNWFRFPLPRNYHIGPKPRVNAATEAGNTLPLDGMQPSTLILPAGSFMSVPLPSGHTRAVCLTADLRTNASGQATATFKPELGEVPADNAVVETAEPFIPMSPTITTIGLDISDGVSGIAFEVEEALDGGSGLPFTFDDAFGRPTFDMDA